MQFFLAPAIVVAIAAMATMLSIASHAWVSKNVTLQQRCIYLFPFCVANGVLFAAIVLGLLRPEMFAAEFVRTTLRSWAFVLGVTMLLLGIYYVAFADEVSVAQEDLLQSKHWWARLHLPHRPHPNKVRIRAIIFLVGGMFVCTQSFAL